MADQSKSIFAYLKEISTAPAGMAVATSSHFDRNAVRGHIRDAIKRAFPRSVEIDQNL